MYYSDEIIEEVRSRNDIVDVISGYVRLTKKGSTYFGLCPFHNEKTGSFCLQKKEDGKVSRAKNPKYESMSLEELRANMEKSKKELEHAIHNKNILEQRKKLVERKERSHRLIVKGAEFEKAFPLSRDLEQEEVQDVMEQLQNSSYNKSIVRQVHIAALHKEQQQIAEAVEKAERGDGS